MPLDHVALTVSDRDRSAAFYAEHFGLTQRVHDDEHLLIVGDEHGSLLALAIGAPAAEDLPRTNHFGFRLPTRDDVLAARERFRVAGAIELEWQDHGPARVQVAGPDGYRVEVYAFQAHQIAHRSGSQAALQARPQAASDLSRAGRDRPQDAGDRCGPRGARDRA